MNARLLSRILNTIAVVLLLSAVAAPAASQDPAARIKALLQERDREIKRLVGPAGTEVPAARREELRRVVNGFIDFPAMAEAALGPFWKNLTPAQRTEFVSVFADIVRGQSLADLTPYRAVVTYKSIVVDGATARVVTDAVHDEIPIVVEYRLVRKGDAWMATDIVLDEVSTVDGYARSFQTMVRKRGFDALMERLRQRRDQLASSD